MVKTKTYQIITLGCKVNQYESASFSTTLEQQGYHQAQPQQFPDLIVINTCAVTAKAGAQSRNTIRKTVRKFPDATFVITGCYSQLDALQCSKIEELQDKRFFFLGNDQKEQLKTLLTKNNPDQKLPDLTSMQQAIHAPHLLVEKFHGRTRAYLKIQDGCNSYCSYCIVPYTRGPSRSVPVEDVLAQAKLFARHGHKEIVITGIHVGHYGLDLNKKTSLTSLIEKLCDQTPDVNFRLSSIEPMEISNELLDLLFLKKNFLNHLHIPLQSGNSDILAMMGRKYTTGMFKEIIEKCHTAIPDLCIGIDVLAGFPGEDDAAFEKTRDFLTDLQYTYLHVFPYSIRPGTRAATFANQVQKQKKEQRVAILRQLSEQKKRQFYKKNLGSVRPVLIEGKRDKKFKLKGFTDNYIPVLIEGSDSLIPGFWRDRERLCLVKLLLLATS